MTTTTKRLAFFGFLLFINTLFQSSANATYYSYYNYSSHIYHHSYSNYNYYWWYDNYYADLRPVARSDRFHGLVGEPFRQNVKKNDYQGDAPAYTRVVAGSLPPGLALRYNGTIVGTPTKTGTYYIKYKLRDQDGDASYNLVKIVIKNPNLLPEAVDDDYNGEIGEQFSQNIIQDNDTEGDGPATAELTGGELPPGISLNADGTLSGTPEVSGIYVAHYTITDANGDTSSASVTITVQEPISYCPQPALSDELHGGSHSHALWIPEISRNLQFEGTPEANRILPNGDMVIVGSVVDGDLAFDIELNYSGYTDQSDSPKLELKSSAYSENGGPIDPSTWEFYSDFSATLVGTSGDWAGVTLTAVLRGPMTQFGIGANGKNGNFGLANWFTATIESATYGVPDGFSIGQTLVGDVNIDLPSECPRQIVKTQCSVSAFGDGFNNFAGAHSIVIFDSPSRRFSFEPAGNVDVYDNGDVTITGMAIDNNTGSKINVVLEYTDSTDVNATPKLELIPSAYVDQGGPVDPSTWSYFDSFSGTFTGEAGDADYDGVVFTVTARGSVPQIGDGANGKNITFGLSNWFELVVTEAPQSSIFTVGDVFQGDVNIDIKDDCVVTSDPIEAIDDNYVLELGQTLTVNILDNDSLGVPNTTLSFLPEDVPDGFALSGDGTLTGLSLFTGVFRFPYTITDANGNSATAFVTITIEAGEPD